VSRPNTDTMCRPNDCISTSIQYNCAVIYENDADFGNITVIDTPLYRQPKVLPSHKMSPEKTRAFKAYSTHTSIGGVRQALRIIF